MICCYQPPYPLEDHHQTCTHTISHPRDKFIRPVKFGGLAVMVTYLLAQLLITAGALIHFSAWLKV
jgi:hypothetical protein